MRGAVAGIAVFEDRASNLDEAEEMAVSGEVAFHPIHHFDAGGPMTGVTYRGGLVETLSTGDGKTWTIIISAPDGEARMVAAGEGWRARPQTDAPDGPQA